MAWHLFRVMTNERLHWEQTHSGLTRVSNQSGYHLALGRESVHLGKGRLR